MQTRTRPHQSFCYVPGLILCAGTAIAAVCFTSYRADRQQLAAIANDIAPVDLPASERVLALMEWIHSRRGTAANREYFIFRSLGATPVQVLERGGNCADRSRLLASMLHSVGIPATLAMCFDAKTGRPSHTLVEAQVDGGQRMVADPAFNLYFPKDGGGFYDIRGLRATAGLAWRRVEQLRASVPPAQRRSDFYYWARTSYESVSTFNWQKNRLTRLAASVLARIYGDDIYQFRRPAFLEEPKLFVAGASLAMSVVSAGLILLLRRMVSRRRAVQRQTEAAELPQSPNEAVPCGAAVQ